MQAATRSYSILQRPKLLRTSLPRMLEGDDDDDVEGMQSGQVGGGDTMTLRYVTLRYCYNVGG